MFASTPTGSGLYEISELNRRLHCVSCRSDHATNVRHRPPTRAIGTAGHGFRDAGQGESGTKRREKGLARSGNARVRRGMIQLAWRFLDYQKESDLAKWFQARTEDARGSRKKMIVALARKLLIALWHFARDGAIPDGVVLRPAP